MTNYRLLTDKQLDDKAFELDRARSLAISENRHDDANALYWQLAEIWQVIDDREATKLGALYFDQSQQEE